MRLRAVAVVDDMLVKIMSLTRLIQHLLTCACAADR